MADPTTRPRHRPTVVPASATAAVGLGVVSAVLLFSLLMIVTRGLRSEPPPRPPRGAPARLGSHVDVWVAETSPGVKQVLTSEWNQAEWDARQDESTSLGLRVGDHPIALYTLVVFNVSAAPVRVDLAPGSLVLVPPGGAPVPSLDLAPLLDAARATSVATTLRLLGAGRPQVEVPAERVARVPVAFPRRVALGEAEEVRRGDGTVFHRRRMDTREWAGLLQAPSVEALRDL